MPVTHIPSLVAADRLNRGVILAFDDGSLAFYSEALLYSMLPHAERLAEDEDEATQDSPSST